jgi:hypothetical protein
MKVNGACHCGHIWCQSALSWSQDIGSLPGIPKQ